MSRSSGILMHISSLPSNYGIGTFGKEAYKFADFLEYTGQKYWQILPLGHTSYGDSPYQCFSAFAGNPYFIDLDFLVDEGLIDSEDLLSLKFSDNRVDFSDLYQYRYNVLRKAFHNFRKNLDNREYLEFKNSNKFWLEDYSFYMSLKDYFNGESFINWDQNVKIREKNTMEYYRELLENEIEFWNFIQYKFFYQWYNLKKYINSKGIEVIGDIPIYVSLDSCDLWSNPKMFKLDDNMNPITVSGCPPDAFAVDGQLWGNPIYNWDYLEKDNYSWWIKRIEEGLKLFDVLRIDHFRGFESFWEVPYGDKTAKFGKWTKGPGIKLFNVIKEKVKNLKVIAEDLGYLTKEVIEFRDETGFPGMKILQFGFSSRSGNEHTPYNYIENSVVYTGTHDNDTIKGWMESTGDKTDIDFIIDYLNLNLEEGYNWGVIRGAWESVGKIAITLMQDILNLGNESRMNFPSTLGNNWTWRANKNYITKEISEKLYKITKLYGRSNKNDG